MDITCIYMSSMALVGRLEQILGYTYLRIYSLTSFYSYNWTIGPMLGCTYPRICPLGINLQFIMHKYINEHFVPPNYVTQSKY